MVIDSTDAARLNIAKEELHHMMESDVSITKRIYLFTREEQCDI